MTIDTKELRRLAQAASHPTTKGRWIRLFGERTVYDRMEDGCRGIPVVSTDKHPPSSFEAACLDFIAAANPAAINELLDRLEAAEKERDFAKVEIARLHDDIRELTDVRVLDEEDRDLLAWLQGEAKAKLDRLESAEKERDWNAERLEDAVEELTALRAELETERMRLAACGVVALSNTPDSAKQARDMLPEYWSASCGDVARMVDENISLRAKVEKITQQREKADPTAQERTEQPAAEAPAQPPHYADLRDRARAYWAETVVPAVREYLGAFSALGAGRLERNRAKPEGMSAREWLESFQRKESEWMDGRKVSETGVQTLSRKDLWPTEDGSGERLRKSMLAAIKALRGAPMTTSDMLAEAFMESSAAPAEPDTQPAPSVPDGFSREDLEAVADGLDGYEKTVNVGNVTGEGDDHLESTTAYAARFIRAMIAAAPEAKP